VSTGRQTRSSPSAAAAGVTVTILLLAAPFLPAGCKVVPDATQAGSADASDGGGAGASRSAFDAPSWVTQVWASKVLPHFDKDAVDLGKVLDALQHGLDEAGKQYGRRADTEGSPWNFTVRGAGKVVSVNTESRAGTAVVAIDTAAGPQEVTLQLGPVVRGTAVRDSLPFFSFGTVTNQIEFAQAARALNDKAQGDVKPAVPAVKPGTRVEFVGAMNVRPGDAERLVTPVSLRPAGEHEK
jgi:predicted lipoprotein